MIKINNKKGFTLIELLVVISIIGLLSSVVLGSLNSARSKARDTKRKLDLKQLQTALNMYYDKNGSYPITCDDDTYWCPTWYSVTDYGGNLSTSGPGGYIPNLAPTYIPVLPVDPSNRTDGWYGYLYSSDGVNYKLLAHEGPESYPAEGQPFFDEARSVNWDTYEIQPWAWAVYSGTCSNYTEMTDPDKYYNDPYYCWW